VPYVPVFEQDDVPASISSENYPNLVSPEKKVETIATSRVLIAFNTSQNSEHYRRIAKFVEAFFSKIDELRKPPRHPAWRNVKVTATIRGWQRFPTAQQWIDHNAANAAAQRVPGGIDTALVRAQAARAAPGNPVEQERLFQEFLKWSNGQKP
jgi:hypothetical protein